MYVTFSVFSGVFKRRFEGVQMMAAIIHLVVFTDVFYEGNMKHED